MCCMADMSDIAKILKGKLSPEDQEELSSFFDAVAKSPTHLTVSLTEKGPTNGGKSSALVIKMDRNLSNQG